MASGKAAGMLLAARSLMEGAPPDFGLISLLTGRSVAYLEQVARKEGWKVREVAAESRSGLEERLAALARRLMEEMEKLAFEALAGQYDKQRIDTLGTLLKLAERLEAIIRGSGYSAQKEQEDNAELAAALALVDARIVELACELAASLGCQTSFCADRGEGAS
ncbi:hypothetical protein GCM10023174_01430 [Chelativorans composti]|uniref:Uncharacterized protein n=1 Tax=Chelativorans composti TaxID=768533 RepID=A0ABW5DFM5_9HYPH